MSPWPSTARAAAPPNSPGDLSRSRSGERTYEAPPSRREPRRAATSPSRSRARAGSPPVSTMRRRSPLTPFWEKNRLPWKFFPFIFPSFMVTEKRRSVPGQGPTIPGASTMSTEAWGSRREPSICFRNSWNSPSSGGRRNMTETKGSPPSGRPPVKKPHPPSPSGNGNHPEGISTPRGPTEKSRPSPQAPGTARHPTRSATPSARRTMSPGFFIGIPPVFSCGRSDLDATMPMVRAFSRGRRTPPGERWR